MVSELCCSLSAGTPGGGRVKLRDVVGNEQSESLPLPLESEDCGEHSSESLRRASMRSMRRCAMRAALESPLLKLASREYRRASSRPSLSSEEMITGRGELSEAAELNE